VSFEGYRPEASRRHHALDLTERGLYRDSDPNTAVGNRHLSTRTPTVESFNTLAGKDSHAANHGYRSNQSLSCVVFHRERGEFARTKTFADAFDVAEAA